MRAGGWAGSLERWFEMGVLRFQPPHLKTNKKKWLELAHPGEKGGKLHEITLKLLATKFISSY